VLLLYQPRPEPELRLLRCGLAETVAEFFHASAHVVYRLLGAGVEGVGFAGGVELEEGQLAAVFHVDHFLGVCARTCHELEAVGHVLEANFAVVGVNAFFHTLLHQLR